MSSYCGFNRNFQKSYPNVIENIRKIKFQDDIEIINVKDFDKKGIYTPSKYNPPTIKCLFKKDEEGYHLISNIDFDGKIIQFVTIDGNSLTTKQYEDPDAVINLVNNKKLKPIVFPDLSLTPNQMTMIDAYAGSIWYCLFLWEHFNRVGIIDEDKTVFLSIVNIDFKNAFWNNHFMTYGSGIEKRGPKMSPLTSIDIIGHETTHGLIEALGDLDYENESGALNESIGDVIGTCLEMYYDIKSNKDLFGYELGENIVVGGMRSLSNPKSHEQPDTYKGKYWYEGSEDEGGVHTNSGVGNFLFFLCVNRHKGKNDFGVKYEITNPFKMFDYARLLYHTMKKREGFTEIKQNCTYSQFADALLFNSPVYLKERGLDDNLIDTLMEGLIAVGLRDR